MVVGIWYRNRYELNKSDRYVQYLHVCIQGTSFIYNTPPLGPWYGIPLRIWVIYLLRFFHADDLAVALALIYIDLHFLPPLAYPRISLWGSNYM